MLNATLKNAVRYLYGKGLISNDKDIADATGYNKATVSSYINGKTQASGNFIEKFEQVFNLKLKEFEKGGKGEAVEKRDAAQTITETVLLLEAKQDTILQLLIEILAGVTNRSFVEVQTTASNALRSNLAKLEGELKRV
jgi:transcriptional regulator with XRE-family HTH domain